MQGVDFRFQEKMRGVVEYMQYREMPSDIKRKVSEPPSLAQTQPDADGVGSVPPPRPAPPRPASSPRGAAGGPEPPCRVRVARPAVGSVARPAVGSVARPAVGSWTWTAWVRSQPSQRT